MDSSSMDTYSFRSSAAGVDQLASTSRAPTVSVSRRMYGTRPPQVTPDQTSATGVFQVRSPTITAVNQAPAMTSKLNQPAGSRRPATGGPTNSTRHAPVMRMISGARALKKPVKVMAGIQDREVVNESIRREPSDVNRLIQFRVPSSEWT